MNPLESSEKPAVIEKVFPKENGVSYQKIQA